MTKAVQRRRGTTAEHASFTGLNAEVTLDTTKNTAVVHDGTTQGGFPLLREDFNNVTPATGRSALELGTSNNVSFNSVNVSGTTIPVTGIYRPATNVLAASTNTTERMRIDSAGNVLIGKTSATANGGDLQVSSGITFPATQVPKSDANTLDDYEEGTWTPTIAGFTTAGTGTYIAQEGTYTKIGRLVSITGFVAWSAHTGTGVMCLQGFPFGAGSLSSFRTPFSLSEIGNIALSANNTLQMQMQNTSQALFMQSPVGGGVDSTVPMDSAGYFRFSCTYFTT